MIRGYSHPSHYRCTCILHAGKSVSCGEVAMSTYMGGICSVPQWLHAGMAIGRRVQHRCRMCATMVHVAIRIRDMDGRGWGVWGWVANG